MFYVFCVFFALLLVKAVEPSSCDEGKLNAARSTFNSLSDDIIDLDKKVYDICNQFQSTAALEIFGNNAFRLEITLPGLYYGTFVVRVKHRVIYINGHYPRYGANCDLTYVDIKVLPEFVDTRGGAWTYKDGKLFVAFPYAYKIKENNVGCGKNYIDETLFDVRMGTPYETMFSD